MILPLQIQYKSLKRFAIVASQNMASISIDTGNGTAELRYT